MVALGRFALEHILGAAVRASHFAGLQDVKEDTRVGGADFQQLFQSVYDGAVIAETNGDIIDSNGFTSSRGMSLVSVTWNAPCLFRAG